MRRGQHRTTWGGDLGHRRTASPRLDDAVPDVLGTAPAVDRVGVEAVRAEVVVELHRAAFGVASADDAGPALPVAREVESRGLPCVAVGPPGLLELPAGRPHLRAEEPLQPPPVAHEGTWNGCHKWSSLREGVTRPGNTHADGEWRSGITMPGPVFVECDRVDLRTVEAADVEFLQRGTNHPEVRRYIDVFDTPRNREQQRETFENVDSDEDATSLLVVPHEGPDAGEPVGSVQLYPVNLARRWANLGAWLLPEAWGEGYATEACAYLLEHAFGERGLHRVSATALAPSEASVALCERLGLVHEGTSRDLGFVDGEFVDAERYALLAPEWGGAESVLDG